MHHHADHYGGMDAVIRAFHPRIFLDNGSSHTTPNYLKLLRLVRDSGMRVIFAGEASRKIELGSVSLTVLPQPVQKRETLGGEAGPLERRGCYAPSSDCTVSRGNYCLNSVKKKSSPLPRKQLSSPPSRMTFSPRCLM